MNPYKQCPNCGRQFPVTDIFCDNCGCQLDLIAPEQAQPPQQPFVLPTQQPPAQATTVYAEKPKKTGVLIGLLVAILLVLAAMIVLGFFLIHQLNQNDTTNHTSELAAVAQTETTEMAAETEPPAAETAAPEIETKISVVTVIEQVTVPQTDSPSVYAVPTPEPDPQPAGKTYQAFVDACTWADAKQKCEAPAVISLTSPAMKTGIRRFLFCPERGCGMYGWAARPIFPMMVLPSPQAG